MNSYAYFNGKFGKKGDISIPLSDRSIYFGDAIYEVAIGCYDRIMWEEDHLDRLIKNCKAIGIDIGYKKNFLSSLLREIAIRSGLESYLIYLQISRDMPMRKHSADGSKANLLITIDPIEINETEAPLRLITSPDLRYNYCNVKATNLLPAVLASTEAEKRGCDEAIFIRDGLVTEGAKSNILIINQGRVITPPLSPHILPGITRAHLLGICERERIPLEESNFSLQQLYSADEVLITSTTKLCRRADIIDNISVGGKNTELAEFLRSRLYQEYLSCKSPE